jgi:hypothetical protein
MKRIKPLNIVLGLLGMSIGWFGVQALMSNNTGSNEPQSNIQQVRAEAFVELVRAEFPDASKNFIDEVLVVQSIDICWRASQGVSYETVIEDFKTTMAVDSTFAEYFAALSIVTRCPDLSETVIN